MKRPRVLMVTPCPPYPLDGGSKRIHSLCRLLRDRYEFTLLSFRPTLSDLNGAIEDMRREQEFLHPVFENIIWVDPPAAPSPAVVDGLALPREMRRFHSAAMADRLRGLIDAGSADLVHFEFDLMAPYARALRGIPRVLTQHDVGGLSFFHSYFREMSGWGKLARIPDWLSRVRFARQSGSWFDRIVVMTEWDRAALARVSPGDRIRAIPTGVDLGHFRPGDPAARRNDTLVYVGHYPHYPNEDAILHFTRSILPRIQRRHPGIRLLVVGSQPTEALRRAAREQPALVITGTVPNVQPFLDEASVFVAPVRLGHGIKGKILEAFAAGLPVVTTRRAAAGLGATGGRELLVADSASSFAARVLELLDSPPRRAELGARGRAFAEAHFDWSVLASRLGDLYAELL